MIIRHNQKTNLKESDNTTEKSIRGRFTIEVYWVGSL